MRQGCAIGLGPSIFGLIGMLVTSNSAGSITGERQKDTWITLVSTPVMRWSPPGSARLFFRHGGLTTIQAFEPRDPKPTAVRTTPESSMRDRPEVVEKSKPDGERD